MSFTKQGVLVDIRDIVRQYVCIGQVRQCAGVKIIGVYRVEIVRPVYGIGIGGTKVDGREKSILLTSKPSELRKANPAR